MKFSIIIPAYNISEYLEECVSSVITQGTFNGNFDYEVIIVNDGSTDSTKSISDKLAENYPRVKVIHQENQGLSGARNSGIQNAKGEYILFLDGDDFWSDNCFLEKIVTTLGNESVDFILYSYSDFFKNKINSHPFKSQEYTGELDLDVDKLVANKIYSASAWSKCVRSELIKKHTLLFEVGRISEDCFWSIELIKVAKTYCLLNSSQYMYRQNRQGSITHVVKEKNIIDILESTSLGLRDIVNISATKQRALNILSSYFYLSTLPSLYNYSSNPRIRELIESQKYLIKYSYYITDKEYNIRRILAIYFGILPSSFILSKMKIVRNLVRKYRGN